MACQIDAPILEFAKWRFVVSPFDRRSLLQWTGILAASSLASNLQGYALSLETASIGPSQDDEALSPPVYAPFEWAAPDLVFSFEFLDKRLRSRTVLPTGIQHPKDIPASTANSGQETALHCTGEDPNDHHGLKLTGGSPGARLVYIGKREIATATGKRLTIHQTDPVLGLDVESRYETFADLPVVRRSTRVTNVSHKNIGIEYLSSAMLYNLAPPREFEQQLRIHFAHNTWQAEAQWRTVKLSQVGFIDNGNFTISPASFDSIGTWSTQRYLPMGLIENTELGVIWFWQIEHNGTWHWEIANTDAKAVYIYIGGPDELHGHAWKNLKPGESYTTVPAAIGCVRGGFEEAVAALTLYRRAACLRPRADTRRLPVIFNDYMNCLEGDPTTAKELPLIDVAAAAGCEYYVIDAGWYAELKEDWWGSVGAWQPSKTRWPGGLQQVLDRIRAKGMVPGLWLEPEVIGIHSPLKEKPDAWFFQRHGQRIIDHTRYLLDFRNPEVRAYLNSVIDRMVGEYKVGYIKMDYNVDGLEGTEYLADSAGQGLLEHNRALLCWLDEVLARYPDLTIENCGSGGGRMDYAMLSRLQLQSSSDQEDYRFYPAIAVGESAAVLPEQLAIWSYQLTAGDADAASFNLVNAMLFRIHQSGHLAELSPTSFAQVKTGLQIYKEKIRPHIVSALPYYPLGLPDMTDGVSPIALGMRAPKSNFIAVWRLRGGQSVPLAKADPRMRILYPTDLGIRLESTGHGMNVVFPRPMMACILTEGS
jgi:alpha-galactosidase